MKSLIFFVLAFTSWSEATEYPTCTIPDTTIIDRILARLSSYEEQFNANITERIENLESQLTTANENIVRLSGERTLLEQALVSLEGTVESLIQNQTAVAKREKLLNDPSWYTSSNGLQYRVTPSFQSWGKSNEACQTLGGVLAVEGIKNNKERLKIATSLKLENTWIGLSDIVREGVWTWTDGSLSTSSNTEWFPREPSNSGGNQDCGEIWGRNFGYRINDDFCNKNQQALCERNINN